MTNIKSITRLLSVVALNLSLSLLGLGAYAATDTWSGGGADAYWSTAANWAGAAAPGNGSNLVFNGTAQQNNTNDLSNLNVNQVTFNNGGFVLNGNTLTVNGTAPAFFTNTAGTSVITCPLITGPVVAGKYWFVAPNSELRLTGVVTNTATSGTSIGWLSLTNGGTVRIMNLAQSIRGADIFQGNVIVDDGFVQVFSDGYRFKPPTGSTAALLITNNGYLQIGGGGNVLLGCNNGTQGGPAGAGSLSQVTISSGTLELAGTATSIIVGDEIAGATSVFNQNGGLVWGSYGVSNSTTGNAVTIGNAANAAGTYNLNGGTLWIGQISANASATNSAFNFNGGTLKPTASSTTFMQGLLTANVQSGGAILDTTNLNIMIGQNLLAGTPSGGLTKLGAGTLALTGTSTYTGNTIISNGTLTISTGTLTGGGGITVADGATLDVTNAGGTLSASSLTMGSAGTSTLGFDFPLGNTGSASINATTVTGNGIVTINIAGQNFSAGEFPLIQFTGATGLANFSLGSLPSGVSASLVQTANSLDLNISSVVKTLEWSGAANNEWDTSSFNWYDLNNGNNPTNYAQSGGFGDMVTFDNNGANTAIDVPIAVTPVSIIVNSYQTYSFTGAGKISGVASLTDSGFGNLDLATANDYSGGTALNGGGYLYVGNNQALGTGPLALNFGILASDSTASRTLSNNVIISADTGITLGDTVNTGTLNLSGVVDLGGSTTRTLNFNSNVVISGTLTNGGVTAKTGAGSLIVKGTATLNALVNHQQGNVVVDGGSLTSGNGWRIEETASADVSLVVTNGGVFTMTTNTGNILVGLSGGDDSANNFLDIAGTVSTAPLVSSTLNGQVELGQSGANDTLNLYSGGLLICRAITSTSPGNTEADFYGGTLMPLANNAAFMVGLTNAYIHDGGLTVDTTNFNITIGQSLQVAGAGGLTKLGSGTLTLSGTNSYTGLTAVNAGKLVAEPGAVSSGISVAANATMAFLPPALGVTVPVSSVTNANGSALEAEFSGLTGNPSVPAGYVTNLVLNGTTSVNVLGGPLNTGEFPLIGYGTISGSGNLTVGVLPQGTVGYIVTNTVAKTIDLVVSSFVPTIWTGVTNGNWDLLTTNWTSGGAPVAYANYANVIFNDSASNSTVTLTTSLTPSSVVVSNNALSYQFTGSGGLTGSTGLTKYGTNSLALNTANSFSGSVTINAGTIVMGSSTALGGGTNAVVNSGGTLDINGNQVEPMLATVSGSGVGGEGAIVNNSGTTQNDAFRSVVMTGDTTIGGNGGTIGIRTIVDSDLGLVGNGHKLTKVGSNQVNLNGGETVAGLTNIWFTDIGDVDIQAGQLSFQRRAALGRTNNTITVESGASLSLFSLDETLPVPVNNIVMTNGQIQGTGAVGTVNTLGGTITLNGASNSIAIIVWVGTTGPTLLYLNGPIVGSGGVTYSGAINGGVISLGGTNTYMGITEITNGTLTLAATGQLTGTTNIYIDTTGILDVSAAAPWTLGANQTLSGFGAVNGSVQANGTVSPSASTGTLTFNNNLTLAGTSVLELDKDGGLTNDTIAVSGTLTYGGALQVILTGGTPLAVNDTFKLFNFVGAPSGSFSSISLPPGYTWNTNNLSANGTIEVTGVVSSSPQIGAVNVSNGNLTMTGSGGSPGGTYYVLSSTNVALPFFNWVSVLTNTFAPNGNFTNSVPVSPNEPICFYILKLQ